MEFLSVFLGPLWGPLCNQMRWENFLRWLQIPKNKNDLHVYNWYKYHMVDYITSMLQQIWAVWVLSLGVYSQLWKQKAQYVDKNNHNFSVPSLINKSTIQPVPLCQMSPLLPPCTQCCFFLDVCFVYSVVTLVLQKMNPSGQWQVQVKVTQNQILLEA